MKKQKFTSDIVIGLEIHTELDTKSKLFCSCVTKPKNEKDIPNSRTCPICLGHPGSKPVLNKKAVDYALMLCLALNCEVAPELVFSRKSYFYPDMAKNYQITQYELPLGKNGKVKISDDFQVGITRVHIEEDPASITYPKTMIDSDYVLVDYNRSGNALCEIVTEPDMQSAEQARDFMKRLITILEYLKIFDSKNGIIKADANVSIKESGYVRSEIKNITGFKDIERALNYEIERQKKLVKEGKKLKQETRAWDANFGITRDLRIKETEADYGYILDPDLVPVDITKAWVHDIKKKMPELAHNKIKKYIKDYKIKKEDAEILAAEQKLAEIFEKVALEIDPILAAKWLRRELVRVLNYNKKTINEVEIDEKRIVELLNLVESKKITETNAQKILEKLIEKPFDVNEYVKKENLSVISDSGELEKFCEEAIKENPKAVEDYKSGNEKSIDFLMGKVMQKTRGKADPKTVKELLIKKIK